MISQFIRSIAAWFACAAALASPTWAFGADGIVAYSAAYEVEYKGRKVGASELELSYDAERRVYHFASRTSAKGLARLASPNPTVEESSFVVAADGAIQPLEFRYQDGSRSGEDDLHLKFDWERSVAVATDAAGTRELALTAGVLDRASMQARLMRDLAHGQEPARYPLIDGEAVKDYTYSAQGATQLRTGVGALDTVVYVQRREGSSRETWLWLAPSLHYLPVRIEQRRDGETRMALLVQRVSGLTEH